MTEYIEFHVRNCMYHAVLFYFCIFSVKIDQV